VSAVLGTALILMAFSSTAMAKGSGDGAANSMGISTTAVSNASISNFKVKTSYSSRTFNDIASDAWYASYVKKAFEFDIMNGKGAGVFDPTGNIRISEALKMACVVHSIYNGNATVFAQNAQPWYQPYVDYAKDNDILGNVGIADYNAYIDRDVMAYYFSRALPDSELAAINDVVTLPDVNQADNVGAAVFKLYRAGILTGNDSYGTFEPDSKITRAQAAAIITRLVVLSERKHFILNTVSLTNEKSGLLNTRRSWYSTANGLLDICHQVYLGDAATAYFYDNGLILLEEYAEYNPETDGYVDGSYNFSWYCMSGELYCIVMTDPTTGVDINTLFFSKGVLLGWKDSKGISHYNGYRWDEMQGYYAYAKAQCDDVSTRYGSY